MFKKYNEIVVKPSNSRGGRNVFIISNKKQSRIGSVLLLFNIDPKTCKFFSKLSEEIINFI